MQTALGLFHLVPKYKPWVCFFGCEVPSPKTTPFLCRFLHRHADTEVARYYLLPATVGCSARPAQKFRDVFFWKVFAPRVIPFCLSAAQGMREGPRDKPFPEAFPVGPTSNPWSRKGHATIWFLQRDQLQSPGRISWPIGPIAPASVLWAGRRARWPAWRCCCWASGRPGLGSGPASELRASGVRDGGKGSCKGSGGGGGRGETGFVFWCGGLVFLSFCFCNGSGKASFAEIVSRREIIRLEGLYTGGGGIPVLNPDGTGIVFRPTSTSTTGETIFARVDPVPLQPA